MSLPGDFVGDAGQVANGVANVFQTGGGGDFAKLRHGHEEILTAEGAEDPMKYELLPNLQFAAKTLRSGAMSANGDVIASYAASESCDCWKHSSRIRRSSQ